MSYPDPNNPFTPPAAPVAWQQPNQPFQPLHSIEYFRIYSYVFENPNWLTILFWGALCGLSQMLIPIVGALLLIGYQFEVIDALLATRGQRYPDFDLNRFGDYLGRSLWPFLVRLVAGLAMFVVLGLPMILLVAVGASFGDNGGDAVIGFGMLLFMLLLIPLMIAASVLLVPMAFRAGLAGNFGEGFNVAWLKDFLSRVWLELVLGILFLGISASILGFCGFLLCILPVFLVQPLVMLAEAHLLYQVYSLYLTRGGQPIPPRPGPYAVPLPQAMNPPQPTNPPHGFRD